MSNREQNPEAFSDQAATPDSTGEPAHVTLEHKPVAGTGHRHPMGSTDASEVSTGRTDQREASRDENRNMGGHTTSDTRPETEFRENPPTRGGVTGTEANDAF